MKKTHSRVVFLAGPIVGAVAISIALYLAGCGGESMELMVRSKITAALARRAQATRTKDIDAYMESIPKDLVLRQESGTIITRDQIRADVLRDWSLITKTISITEVIDSIKVNDDSAIVYTSQLWERLMPEHGSKAVDTVLTRLNRRELWRNTSDGWFRYRLENLGGRIFINGYPYP